MTTNEVRSTLMVLSIARPERPAHEPRLVELMREIPGDAIAALKVAVRVLEVQGVLCETPDAAIDAATAAGFVPYTSDKHPPADQLALVLLRYPMIGPAAASVRVTSGRGTTAYPALAAFREPVMVVP